MRIESQKTQKSAPKNLEEQTISMVGKTIYEKLVKGYTEKQWGKDCKELSPDIIKRLPLRFSYNNNYFNDKYQGIPIGGYNKLFESLLKGIEVKTDCDYFSDREYFSSIADKIVFTGCIDEYYDTGDEGYLNYLDEISDDLIRKVVGARYNKSQEMDNYIYDKKNKKHFWGSGDIDTKFDKSKAGRKNKKNYKTKKKFLKKHEEYDKVYNDYYENEIDDDKLENKFKKRGLNTYAKIHSYTYDLLSRNQDHRFKRYEKKRHEYEEKSNNEYKKLETNHDRFKRYEEEKRHEEHDDKNQESKPSISSAHSFGTSGKPAVINNNNRGFLSNHKKAIGLGAAGLVGAALAARKIAALRKQQQQHPGLRGKLQAIINRLKSKLRR